MKKIKLLSISLFFISIMFIVSSCSKTKDGKTNCTKYYTVNNELFDCYNELCTVENFSKSDENICIYGVSENTVSYDEKIKLIDMDKNTNEDVNININEFCQEILYKKIWKTDSFYLLYVEEKNGNELLMLDSQSMGVVGRCSLDNGGVAVNCYINSCGNIEIIVQEDNIFGASVSTRIFDIKSGQFNDGMDYGFFHSAEILSLYCKNTDELFILYSMKDDAGENYNIKADKFSDDGSKLLSFETDFMSDLNVCGVYLDRGGNLCLAYQNTKMSETLFIDEYNTTDGTLNSAYEIDVSENIRILSGSTEDHDFICYDNDNIYKCCVDENKYETIFSFPDKLNESNIYESDNKLVIDTVIRTENEKKSVLKLDKNGKVMDKIDIRASEDMKVRSTDILNGEICYLESNDSDNSFRIWLTDGFKTASAIVEDISSYHVVSLTTDIDENIYLISEDAENSKLVINIYSSKGEFYSEITCDNCISFNETVKAADKGIVVSYFNSDYDIVCSKISFDNQKEDLLNNELYYADNFRICQGNGNYIFYYFTKDGLYGYKPNGDVDEVVNWMKNDIYLEISDVCIMDDSRMIVYAKNQELNKNDFYCMTPADEKTISIIKKRKEIVLGGYGMFSSDLFPVIKNYNMKHNDIHLLVTDYSSYGYQNKKENKGWLIENFPDILILSPEFDFSNYNYCEDLSKYIEKDLDSDKYFENIIKIFQNKNGVYKIPFSFDVISFEGSSEESKKYKNIDSFISDCGEYNNETDEMINNLLVKNSCEFINMNEFSCNFECNDFCRLLEFVKNSKSDNKIGIYYDAFSLCDYSSLVESEFDNCRPPSLTGYPGCSSTENLMQTGNAFCISAKSKYKKEAWDFLKTLLEKEYQEKIKKNYPVYKDVFENNLNMVYKELYHMYGGTAENSKNELIKFETMDKNYITDIIENNIENVSHYIINEAAISDIITKETEIFINSSQSSSECAKKIQNKVSLYLNEISE